jgi:hypothetical protein
MSMQSADRRERIGGQLEGSEKFTEVQLSFSVRLTPERPLWESEGPNLIPAASEIPACLSGLAGLRRLAELPKFPMLRLIVLILMHEQAESPIPRDSSGTLNTEALQATSAERIC